MIRRCAFLLACCVFFCVNRCANVTTTDNGGSSETVNARVALCGTTIRVIAEDQGVDGLSLHAYSPDYHPYEDYGFIDSSESGGPGVLTWSAPAQASFNFLIIAKPSGSACFLQAISLGEGINDTITCTLGPCRSLAGYVTKTDSASLTGQYVLSIYGSPFYGLTNSASRFTFQGVPSGSYTISVLPAAQRLFVSTADYSIVTDSLSSNAQLRIVLP